MLNTVCLHATPATERGGRRLRQRRRRHNNASGGWSASRTAGATMHNYLYWLHLCVLGLTRPWIFGARAREHTLAHTHTTNNVRARIETGMPMHTHTHTHERTERRSERTNEMQNRPFRATLNSRLRRAARSTVHASPTMTMTETTTTTTRLGRFHAHNRRAIYTHTTHALARARSHTQARDYNNTHNTVSCVCVYIYIKRTALLAGRALFCPFAPNTNRLECVCVIVRESVLCKLCLHKQRGKTENIIDAHVCGTDS